MVDPQNPEEIETDLQGKYVFWKAKESMLEEMDKFCLVVSQMLKVPMLMISG